MSEARLLVMGFGSPLRGDDMVGVLAIRRLRELGCWPEGVELVDGGVRGIDLLARIADYDRVILLDSMMCGENEGEVGDVFHLPLETVRPRTKAVASLHHFDLGSVLRLGEALDLRLPPVELVVMRIHSATAGAELSLAARRALPSMIDMARQRIEAFALGVSPAQVENRLQTG